MSEHTTDLVIHNNGIDTDSWITVLAPAAELAANIANTEFAPKGLRGSVEKVTAAILYGRELGMPPMTALAQIHVVEGRPALSAEAMRAKVLQAGHEIEFGEMSSTRCSVRGRRRGAQNWTVVEWSIADAQRANLANKTNWKTHPRRMLQARASAELCKLAFADVIAGLSVVEEMEDLVIDGNTGEVMASAPEKTQTRTVQRRRATKAAQAPAPVAPSVPVPDPVPAVAAPPAPVPMPVPEQWDTPSMPPPPAPAYPDQDDSVGEPEPVAEPPRVSPSQMRMLGALWGKLGVTDDDRREFTAVLVGRELANGTTKDLTKREASALIDELTKLDGNPDALDRLVQDRIAQGGES